MIICNSCGTPLSDGLTFCAECGEAAPNRQPAVLTRAAESTIEMETPATTNALPPNAWENYSSNTPTQAIGSANELVAAAAPPSRKTATPKIVMLVIAGTVIAVLGTIAILASRSRSSATSPDSVASSLQSAIQSGRLVTLSNDDAYSYFFRLKGLDPQHKALTEVKSRVLPQLRALGDEVFQRRVTTALELITERDWTIALHAYEWAHVLEVGDKTIEARWKYAGAHLARLQGRRDESQNSLYAATQLDPSWASPQNDLGYSCALSKKYSDAIPYYQRAINLQADWDIPYNNMGTAYYYLRNYDTAEAWYRKALQVNAQWATPHAWLGSIYENKRLNDAAVQEYQTALNLYNPNRGRINTTELETKINNLKGIDER